MELPPAASPRAARWRRKFSGLAASYPGGSSTRSWSSAPRPWHVPPHATRWSFPASAACEDLKPESLVQLAVGGVEPLGPPLRPRTAGAERLGPASTDRLRPGEVDSEDNLLQVLLADDVPAPTLQRRRSTLDCAEHIGQLLLADTMSLVPWVLRTHRLFPTVAAAGQGVRLPSVTFLRGSERRDEHCGTGHWQCWGLQSSAACEGRSAGGGLPSLLSTSPHLFSSALACGHPRCFRRWMPQVRAPPLHPFNLFAATEPCRHASGRRGRDSIALP